MSNIDDDLGLDDLCDECGHRIRLHGQPEGCQYERGDRYQSGYAPMAMGPCGCRAWSQEAARYTNATTPRPLVYLCLVVLLTGTLLAAFDILRGVPWP